MEVSHWYSWYAETYTPIHGDHDKLTCRKRINIPTETIELAEMSSPDVNGLSETINGTEPRYSFFRYVHESDGREEAPIAFIYTCPSESKVKERMTYASLRNGMVLSASSDAGVVIDKKV